VSILGTLSSHACHSQPRLSGASSLHLHNTPLLLTSTQSIAVDLQENAEPAADKLATPIEEKAKQVGNAAVPTADAASEDLKNVAASVGQVCAADNDCYGAASMWACLPDMRQELTESRMECWTAAQLLADTSQCWNAGSQSDA